MEGEITNYKKGIICPVSTEAERKNDKNDKKNIHDYRNDVKDKINIYMNKNLNTRR